MAPNHSEQPNPDPSSNDGGPGDLSVTPSISSDPAEGLSMDVPHVDGSTDTGSLSISLLVAPAPDASRDLGEGPIVGPVVEPLVERLTEPAAGQPVEPLVLADEDLPPLRTSELAIRWTEQQIVGGVPFVVSDPLLAARDLAEAAVVGAGGEHIHLANAYSVSLANEFPELAAETFCAGGWNLPDGRPISWISRLRHDRPVLHQVRGPQFMLDVCEAGVDLGVRHFLLGGAPEVLERLETALHERFPGIRIVGSFSPPYRDPTSAELAERDAAIMTSGAQVIWVGLGTPKQDREAARLARSTGLVAVAVGAAFDFAAGTMREAPGWVRRIGMEWLFRLIMEPRRLWRRYLIGNVRFLRAALRARPAGRF